MQVGSAIKTVRKKKGWSQSDLRKKCDLDQSWLSLIETGKKYPTIQMLNKIAECLEVPTVILLWHGITEEDVKPEKLDQYKTLKKSIDAMIETIWGDE